MLAEEDLRSKYTRLPLHVVELQACRRQMKRNGKYDHFFLFGCLLGERERLKFLLSFLQKAKVVVLGYSKTLLLFVHISCGHMWTHVDRFFYCVLKVLYLSVFLKTCARASLLRQDDAPCGHMWTHERRESKKARFYAGFFLSTWFLVQNGTKKLYKIKKCGIFSSKELMLMKKGRSTGRPLKVEKSIIYEAVNLWLTSELSRKEVLEKYKDKGVTLRMITYHSSKIRGEQHG